MSSGFTETNLVPGIFAVIAIFSSKDEKEPLYLSVPPAGAGRGDCAWVQFPYFVGYVKRSARIQAPLASIDFP